MAFQKKAGTHGGVPGATLRQMLEFAGLVVFGRIVRCLPRRWLLPSARALGSIAYLLDSKGRVVSRQNLDAVFGDRMDAAEKARVARSGYVGFARTMIELFWSPNLTEKIVRELFATEGICEPPGATIFITTHSSNFEWLGQNLGFLIGPGIVVAQQLENPLLGRYFDSLRGNSGHTVIPQERAISRMLTHLRSGGYFCVLVDLNLDPGEASVIIDEFSGLKTCVTQIHAALALHTGAKIIPSECIPLPDGSYRMLYHPPLKIADGATPADIAQQCWDVLEPGILSRPECWLWSYKHWRFRPSGTDPGRYPPYSNNAKRFDSALRKSRAPRAAAALHSGWK